MSEPRIFGDLVATHRVRGNVWEYRCTKVQPDGTICQNVRHLYSFRAHRYKSCFECGKVAQGHRSNVRSVLTLTAHQRERFAEIMRGRTGRAATLEALEIIEIETRNKGACCIVHMNRKKAA